MTISLRRSESQLPHRVMPMVAQIPMGAGTEPIPGENLLCSEYLPKYNFLSYYRRSPTDRSCDCGYPMHSGEELVAGNRKPGPQNPFSTPQNIRDGTNSLQPTPKPSTSGFWQGVESASDGVYAVLSQRLLTLANQGLSAMDLQRSLLAKYGDQAAAEAEKYFGYVTDQ